MALNVLKPQWVMLPMKNNVIIVLKYNDIISIINSGGNVKEYNDRVNHPFFLIPEMHHILYIFHISDHD